MSHFSKRFLVMTVIGISLFSVCGVSFAADKEHSLTGFLRNLFHYPVKATQETASMTANTLNNAGEKVVSKAGENTAGMLKGDLSKTGSLAADAVKGTAETAGQTVAETAQIPVKAAEEKK